MNNSPDSITTTAPQADHRDAWERLYRGYADYYQMAMTEEGLATVWGWIHDDAEPFHCRLALSTSGEPVGLAHFRPMPSPLRGTRVGFLDDLFVDPVYRGSGAVEALFDALKQEAKRQGWPLVRWITREDNYRGRAVYDKLAMHTNWQTYELKL